MAELDAVSRLPKSVIGEMLCWRELGFGTSAFLTGLWNED